MTLGDHVADVVAVFHEHDLVDATLVGHSYGGRVITKAWPEVAAESAADGLPRCPRSARTDG